VADEYGSPDVGTLQGVSVGVRRQRERRKRSVLNFTYGLVMEMADRGVEDTR
jgi:hypothetical protein